MKFAYLKKIRVAVSLIFFLLTITIFLDFTNRVTAGFIGTVTWLQFIPSILKFAVAPGAAAAGFAIVIILTLLFGRVYCSSICPMGTLQDIISYIIRKFKNKKFYYHSKARNLLRYSILIITAAAAFSGFILLVNLLDPFSGSGKIFSNIFRPLLISLNNLISAGLESLGSYIIYPYQIKNFNYLNLIYPGLFLAVIFLLVYRNGRLFCNTLCPAGTFLAVFSRFSLFKIAIEEHNCISCRLCERKCKSGCIDKVNKTIDFTRCVSCFNCFTVCPSEGITFTRNKFEKNKPSIVNKAHRQSSDRSRRKFISKSIIAVCVLAGINYSQIKITPKKKSTVPTKRKHPVTPPGSESIFKFEERCTACHLCIAVCPTQVLQPALTEYGIIGLFQPIMDYSSGFCNYDCAICTESCPSGALKKIAVEKKRLVQLGKAKFTKENCIVYTENTACGACSEHCPTKAVNMVPYKNITIPEVTEDYCTGCGACEHACPTNPYKAIYVEGNPIHLIAKKRTEKKLEQKIQEDFPF